MQSFSSLFRSVFLIGWIVSVAAPSAFATEVSDFDSTFMAAWKSYRPADEIAAILEDMERNARTKWEEAVYYYCKGTHLAGSLQERDAARFYFLKAEKLFAGLEATEPKALDYLMQSRLQLATINFKDGKHREGLQIAEELLPDLRRQKDTNRLIVALNLVLNGATMSGDYEKSLQANEEALTLAYARQDTHYIQGLLGNKSQGLSRQGKYEEALQIQMEIRPYIAPEDSMGHVSYLTQVGRLFYNTNNLQASREALNEALPMAQAKNAPSYQCDIFYILALVDEKEADTLAALDHYQASLSIARESGNTSFVAFNKMNIGILYGAQGEIADAEVYLQEALELFGAMGDPYSESVCYLELGKLAFHQAQTELSLRYLHRADSLCSAIQNWVQIKFVNQYLSEVYESIGDAPKALFHHKRMVEARDSLDFISAKKYSDSLAMTLQSIVPPAGKETPPQEGGRFWWILGSALIVVGGGLALRQWLFKRPAPAPSVPTQESLLGLLENRNWASFLLEFEKAYPGLMQKLGEQFPELSPNDFRVLALSRLGLSVAEMAEIMHISPDSAKKARQRTRKKLALSPKDSLQKFLMDLN